MNLHNYFATQCRATSVLLKTHSPTVKAMVTGRKKQERTGTVATLSFDGFKIDLSFFERGRAAYAQQTIWISFTLDSDETLPFSIYDILAFTEPDNFNCYTYTYVDSRELMRDCFGEINEILSRVIPQLSAIVSNGVEKNRLLTLQREVINKYFGDSVIEQSQMLGGAADNLVNMMMRNFYDSQIEAAVVGSQSYFYMGKEDKALKKLMRSKCRSLYQDNLLKHLQNGGKANDLSETLKKASPEKGARRHGETTSGAVKIFLLGLLIDIPVSAVLILIFFIISKILFHDAILYMGFRENIALMPFFGSLLSMSLSLNMAKNRRNTSKKNDDKTIQDVKTPKAVNTLLKYLIIIGETFALIGCVSSVYCSVAFYGDSVGFSQADFPFSHTEYKYESIDTVAIVEGYTFEEEFTRRPYIAIVTESGAIIDLYNATNYSGDDFRSKADFLTEKDIKVVEVKTIEELK